MTRIDHRWAVAGVAVLSAALLAGCAEDGPNAAPDAWPTASGSPTPSPAVTAVTVAPAPSVAMDDGGPAGAEAAAAYFFSLDSYMQATGDTATWEAMSHTECAYCAARSEQARELHGAGYQWVGGAMTTEIRHSYAQDAVTGIWPIDVTISQATGEVRNEEGTLVEAIPAGRADKRVEVAKRNGTWVIVGVGKSPE